MLRQWNLLWKTVRNVARIVRSEIRDSLYNLQPCIPRRSMQATCPDRPEAKPGPPCYFIVDFCNSSMANATWLTAACEASISIHHATRLAVATIHARHFIQSR
jgi:hypothetical protein